MAEMRNQIINHRDDSSIDILTRTADVVLKSMRITRSLCVVQRSKLSERLLGRLQSPSSRSNSQPALKKLNQWTVSHGIGFGDCLPFDPLAGAGFLLFDPLAGACLSTLPYTKLVAAARVSEGSKTNHVCKWHFLVAGVAFRLNL